MARRRKNAKPNGTKPLLAGTKKSGAVTINVRLAAVRRLANEASDCGLLSPDLAAGIHRVKGAKPPGARFGNG